MTEIEETPGGDLEQIAAERDAFDTLYRNAFEVSRRLGLDPGNHVFDIDHPRYVRVDVTAYAYNSTSVVLYMAPEDIGVSVRAKPYVLKREKIITRISDGNLKYDALDLMVYTSKWRNDEDTVTDELDTFDETYDFSSPLPPDVAELLAEMNEILPQLVIDQHNKEESEGWPKDDPADYMAQLQLQVDLKALERALSTADGAMYLMQLAVLNRHQGQPEDEEEFILPAETPSVYKVSARFDPEPEERGHGWRPDMIMAERSSISGSFRTHADSFKHITTHYFVNFSDKVSYEVADTLQNDEGSKPVAEAIYEFGVDDPLPKDVLDLVKHLLKMIVGKS